jgi:hypothetical protein
MPVWLEMEPLLAKERIRCEELASKLERAVSELERFGAELEPAFSRWYHASFGERLTRARDLEARAMELDELVSQVELEALMEGISERQAFERLERRRRAQQKVDQMRSGEADIEGELDPELEAELKERLDELLGGMSVPPGEYQKLFESFKKDFREQIRRESGQQGGTRGESSRRASDDEEAARREHERARHRAEREAERERKRRAPEAPQTEPDLVDIRIKQLYRELARRLHPDANSNLPPRARELWHEAQAAYERRDLERLEMLAAMRDFAGGGHAATIGFGWIKSLARLKNLYAEMGRKLRSTQKALKRAEQSPAWGFDLRSSKPRDETRLRLEIELELRDATEELEEEIGRLERRVGRWKKPPPGGRARRKS